MRMTSNNDIGDDEVIDEYYDNHTTIDEGDDDCVVTINKRNNNASDVSIMTTMMMRLLIQELLVAMQIILRNEDSSSTNSLLDGLTSKAPSIVEPITDGPSCHCHCGHSTPGIQQWVTSVQVHAPAKNGIALVLPQLTAIVQGSQLFDHQDIVHCRMLIYEEMVCSRVSHKISLGKGGPVQYGRKKLNIV
eukprot:scaffold51834_cov67-Attheya_sp.AAC.2